MLYRRAVPLLGLALTITLLASCGNPPPVDGPVDAPDAGVIGPPGGPGTPNVIGGPTTSIAPPPTTPVTPPPEVDPESPETEPEPEAELPSPAGFRHPGVLVDLDQLRDVRSEIAAGQQPWTAAYLRMRDSGSSSVTSVRPKPMRFSSLDYRPAPVTEIRCWAGTGAAYAAANPQLGLKESGCREQTDDAMAAYTHALMWYFTGNEAHAKKSIEIMDAWSGSLRHIAFDQPRTNKNQQIFANGLLQAAWTGQLLPRAAEIIRYTYDGWSPAGIQRFSSMLKDVILPVIWNGWTGGANGLMSYAEAITGIGVFTDDRAIFDRGVALWRQHVKTTIYMPSDGASPIAPSAMYAGAATNGYWFRPTSYVPGLHGETGRDLSHAMLGMGAMSNAASTASIQGVDLFGEERARITSAYELHAGFVNQYLDEKARRGGAEPPSTWRPTGWVNPNFVIGGTAYTHGWEVAYNHYAERGVSMPQSKRLVERLRPAGPAMTLIWETLTHAG